MYVLFSLRSPPVLAPNLTLSAYCKTHINRFPFFPSVDVDILPCEKVPWQKRRIIHELSFVAHI